MFYVPHLLEEALTGMHDDAPIVTAYAWLASLGPRHAAYLVFQATFAVALSAVALVARGGRARAAVLAALGVALLGEGHHVVRALITTSYNPGLVTGLAMPCVGVFLLQSLHRLSKDVPCSTT
jgi:hypothetical protein